MSIEHFKLNRRCFSFYRLRVIKKNCKISLKFHSSRHNKRIWNFCLVLLNSISLVVNVFKVFLHTILVLHVFAPLLLLLPAAPCCNPGRLTERCHTDGLPGLWLPVKFNHWRTLATAKKGVVARESLSTLQLALSTFLSLGSSIHFLPSHRQVVTLLFPLAPNPPNFTNSPKILIGSCHLPLWCCQINHLSWYLRQLYKIFAPFHNRIFRFIEKENDLPKVTKLVSSWNSAVLTLSKCFFYTPALPPFTGII